MSTTNFLTGATPKQHAAFAAKAQAAGHTTVHFIKKKKKVVKKVSAKQAALLANSFKAKKFGNLKTDKTDTPPNPDTILPMRGK